MGMGPAENAGLGPCDLQDPLWAKMSALASGANKKRKKSETKPQAQINKCNNEKRRREQENIYIEELAELISANFADMSSLSVKPDKCAILQETVNQIRSIKQRESASQSSDPVQQGEVSSSRPTILTNEVFYPLLLEALEGFLFVVNAEGKVEFVTENVPTYIKFTREEVLGNSIYNFIHHGDHARFHSYLLPKSIGWAAEPTNRSRSFTIRLLVKPPEEQDETVEEKQQRFSNYEVMHISSTQLPDQVTAVSDEDGSDSGPCLLCVASRISHRDKVASSIEQFTTKLDTNGKIIGVDASGVTGAYASYFNKDLMDRVLKDLVPAAEVHKLNAHLRDTVNSGQATSACYRLQIAPDKFVQVQTKSKLFKTNSPNDPDFIMATHSIISDNDAIGPTDPGGGTSGNSSVGGPLMTSIVNGARNGAPVSSGSDSSTTSSTNTLLTTTNTTFNTTFLENEFNFEIFPSTTWGELEPPPWSTEARPESRQSVTPVSTPTPRPASNPSTVAQQSPMAQFVAQQSPSVANPPTPANPYNSTFPFSPLTDSGFPMDDQQKDTKASVLEEANNMMADSGRLRNLLTKPPNNADSDSDGRNKNRILKGLLNQQDDDERSDNRTSPRTLMNRGPLAGPSNELPNKSSASAGRNNMLLELLNDKSDDDDHETKAGIKNKSELLQQLLKGERDSNDEKKNDLQSQDDSLLRSLGFTSSPSPPNGEPGRARKRPSDDRDDNPNKRSSDGSQVSSSGPSTGGSKLCEKNKMLASLLAKQPSNHQPIPPIPASVISATPQEKLPKITDPNLTKNLNNRLMSHQQQQQQSQQQNLMNNARLPNVRIPGRPQTNYLNSMLSPANNSIQRTDSRLGQVAQACYSSPATSSTDNNNTWSNNNNMQTSMDPVLSELLDQVIEIVPDDIMNISDGADQQQNTFQNQEMAIKFIQKSLMQCESAVKNPLSPISPGALPGYSATMSTQNSRVFPPPPNYPQSGYKLNQRIPPRPNVNYSLAGAGGTTVANHQQLQFQRTIQTQQLEEKRRLLKRQQQQHLLIPSNATASEISTGIQNIDSLLNNTVAPNVSLQRSASVPEPQSSPNYQQAQRNVGGQQPYSPHSQLASPIQQQQQGFPPQTTVSSYQQQQARLSPQTNFAPQLSPRQAYPQATNTANTNWQQQPRLSVQNPMLNAQLTGNYMPGGPNGRNFQRAPQQQQPQQRSINSPGTRQSPFAADSYAPPSSPNSAFNQSQYLRLHRTNSAPSATTQLPGGLGSPRPYGRDPHPHSYPPSQQQHHHQPPMMYPQDAQYCYDQTGLQLAYNGADRGRAPPHLHAGVTGSGTTSEFVRQELRAIVGARTGQNQPQQNRPSQLVNQQSQQVSELEALSYDLQASGGSESSKLWGPMGSDMGSLSPQPATSRSSIEGRQDDHKSSLLQKLLSE